MKSRVNLGESEPIDLVYVLGHGSLWDNNELRYSLRSVEKYLSGYQGVYIVGTCPDWITKVQHIPFGDLGKNKPENIYRKVLRACLQPDVSERFLFMNDDFFFTHQFNADFPYLTDGELKEAAAKCKNGPYAEALKATINALEPLTANPLHYDIHTPIIYDKKLFQEIMPSFDWKRAMYGMVVKSLYANSITLPSAPVMYQDLKINHPCSSEAELRGLIGDRFMFSIGEYAVNDVLTSFLCKEFPNKSKYEL